MFKNISWSSYGIFILITLIVYYATIGILYYSNDIKQVLSGKSSLLLKLNPSKKFIGGAHLPSQNSTNEKGFTQQSNEDLHPLAADCITDINLALQHAANNNLVKQEVIYSLQQLISKYPLIKDVSFKSFITNYILTECANYCSIHLDEDELKEIWAK